MAIQKVRTKKEKKRPKKQRIPLMTRLRHFFALTPGSDPWVTLAALILVCAGTLMVVSTNVGQSTSNSVIVLTTLIRQCIYIVLSLLCMWGVNHLFNFRWFSAIQGVAVLAVFGIMLVPLLFASVNGSNAWIQLPGGMSIQPSEFGKPFMILVCGASLYQARKNPERTKNWRRLFRTPILCYVLMAVALVLQRDIGTLAIYTVVFFVCLLIPTYPGVQSFQKRLKRLTVILVLAGACVFLFSDKGAEILENTPFAHIAVRIANAKNPFTDVYGDGYQPANALYGIASGGLFGKGIGNSTRKYGYLTQADNDYILAVIVEETGIFGLGLICILYGLLIYRFFYYAFKTNEMAYKTVLVGSATYLFTHFALNVGGVSGLIPATGVPLLFISSGGSALMAVFVTVGLCQQCISQIRIKEMDHADRSR